MPHTSAVAIFCEDIRQEEGGQNTIVGTLPSTMVVSKLPGGRPKLAVYLRVHLDLDASEKPIKARVMVPGPQPDSQKVNLIEIPLNPTEASKRKAEKNGLPYVGLVCCIIISLTMDASGQLEVLLDVGDEVLQCGTLNVIEAENQEPDTATPA